MKDVGVPQAGSATEYAVVLLGEPSYGFCTGGWMMGMGDASGFELEGSFMAQSLARYHPNGQ